MVRHSVCGHHRTENGGGDPEPVQDKNEREVDGTQNETVEQEQVLCSSPSVRRISWSDRRRYPGSSWFVDFLTSLVRLLGIHAPLNEDDFENGENREYQRIQRVRTAWALMPRGIRAVEELNDELDDLEACEDMPDASHSADGRANRMLDLGFGWLWHPWHSPSPVLRAPCSALSDFRSFGFLRFLRFFRLGFADSSDSFWQPVRVLSSSPIRFHPIHPLMSHRSRRSYPAGHSTIRQCLHRIRQARPRILRTLSVVSPVSSCDSADSSVELFTGLILSIFRLVFI